VLRIQLGNVGAVLSCRYESNLAVQRQSAVC
jgi:hypothetical protein